MLFIVGTPIGNIEDISLRAIKTLCTSDFILCEDTRTFGVFLKRAKHLYGIKNTNKNKLISFYKENEYKRIPEVLNILKDGNDVSIVSESGMPLISDPGYDLINRIIKSNIKYTVIPGPSAFTTAVLLSGFKADNMLFQGFLPKKKSQVIRLIKKLKMNNSNNRINTIVFYESPNRINRTLKIISEVLPDIKISICREMTKKFEEVISGNAKKLMKREYRGEITVVLEFFQR